MRALEIVIAILLAVYVIAEIWFWLVYVPRGWRRRGPNRDYGGGVDADGE